MLKCSRKLKIGLLMGAVYIALMAVLFTEISYAKYQEERLAYANFGAASFNAVILSADNTRNDMLAGEVNKFDVFAVLEEPLEMQITDYRPGMTYDGEDPTKDTSKKIPFIIANGIDDESASEANVQYQIALRTTGHLPLKYSLLHKKTGEKLRYEAGTEKTEIQAGTVWYEQHFMETVPGGGQREVTFDLPGGILSLNEYDLIVEWPIETVAGISTNDVRYMKEVELLQLFVTVSSKNMLEEDGYGANATIELEYGNGAVILDPSKGGSFVHYLDYRAFRKEEDESTTSYTLTIENGTNKQIVQKTENTEYTFEIEVPWTDKTDTFIYSIQRTGAEAVELNSSEYRLYDELYNSKGYNTYEPVTNPTAEQITEWSGEKSEKRLYKVFRITGEPMENAVHTAHEYHLILSGSGTSNILQDTAVAHKLKVLVMAEYTGSPIVPTVQTEGGGTDG